jgi:hypothetical protein
MKPQKYILLGIAFAIVLLSGLGLYMPQGEIAATDEITVISAEEHDDTISAETGHNLFEDDHFNPVQNFPVFFDFPSRIPVVQTTRVYSEYNKSPWLPPRLS